MKHNADSEGYCLVDGLDWPCPSFISTDSLIAATFYEPPAVVNDPASLLLGLVAGHESEGSES